MFGSLLLKVWQSLFHSFENRTNMTEHDVHTSVVIVDLDKFQVYIVAN